MTELDVNDCRLLDGPAVVAEIARRCHGLEVLGLPSEAATDVALDALGAHCVRLRSLDVTGGRLTDAGLSRLLARCPRLQVLHLNHCPDVGVAGLRAIAAHCKDLRVLCAYGCKTEAGKEGAVDDIVAACEHLTTCRC